MTKEKVMNVTIARLSKPEGRLFPPISPNLYDIVEAPNLTPKQQIARKILALANRDYSIWEHLLGWKLDSPGKIGRLMLLHKKAMLAELEKQWKQADFFWEEFYKMLEPLYNITALWDDFNAFVGGKQVNNCVQIRQCIFEEIFIDTHCAFYNGAIQQVEMLTPKDRAFVHIDYLEKLMNISNISRDKYKSIFGPLAEMQIKMYQEREDWYRAIEVNLALLERFPDLVEYKRNLALLYQAKIMDELLNGESESDNLHDAGILEKGIKDLEKLRKEFPYNLVFHEVLANLCHLFAIKLANCGEYSDALVAALKAFTYDPYFDVAKKTYDELVNMMKKLKARIEQLQSQVARSNMDLSVPNMGLNVQGMKMQIETRKGFGPVNEYSKSDEAQKISDTFYIAQARSIWQDVGLPEPPDKQWNEVAFLLLNGLVKVINNPPQKKSELTSAWKKIAEENAQLAKLDATAICGYLKRRLFDKEKSQTHQKIFKSPKDPPILSTSKEEIKQKEEPFKDWLYSKKGIRLKLQAVFAAILILMVSIFTISDAINRNNRNKAFRQITAAVKSNDYIGIIEGVEKFFSKRIFSGKDKREPYVKELYDEAIVRFFTTQGDELDDNALRHLQRYQKLINNSKY